MDLQIRKAGLKDAGPLAELLMSLGLSSQIQVEQTRQKTFDHLKQCLSEDCRTIYVAASESGSLAGYIAVHWLPYFILGGTEGFISELFIQESFRGQGAGSRLLAVVIEEAKSRGCVRLQLINFRDRESYKRGFYSKAGWTERSDAASFVLHLNR